MENILNFLYVDKVLSDTSVDKTNYLHLVQTLYIYCIELDINKKEIQFSEIEKEINLLRDIEKISLFLFSNYTNVLKKDFEDSLITNAMNISAIAFEKLAKYLEYIDTDQLDENSILIKTMRYYFRSSVAYLLASNSANSILMAQKFKEKLTLVKAKPQLLNSSTLELLGFCSLILSRNFNLNSLENSFYKSIIIKFHQYKVLGERRYIEEIIEKINELIDEKAEIYESTECWYIKYLLLCIKKIFETSVWTLLKDKYTDEYIRQLVQSRPSIFELWPNQIKIINDKKGFINNENIRRTIINFPTSGGKSLIAEMAIVKELENSIGMKCLYIVPTNALVYEVTKRLKGRFRKLKYKVANVPGGYESNIEEYIQENVIVTTPEKLSSIIRNNNDNRFLDSVSLIIFDEFHKISEKERGWIIESNIWFLVSHDEYRKIRLLILSAIIDNGELIKEWVGDSDNTVLYSDSWTPTLRVRGIAYNRYVEDSNGRWRLIPPEHKWFKQDVTSYFAEGRILYKIRQEERQLSDLYRITLFTFPRYHDSSRRLNVDLNIKKENFIMGVAQKLENVGGNLIFFNTKFDCEDFIRNYEPFFDEKLFIRDEVIKLIEYTKKRLGPEHLLVMGLEKGVAYHHGSLPLDIREAIEDFYTKGYIKNIICTTTLAEGVNFPIQNFIYTGLKYNGQQTIDLGTFKNIAGRAGRAYQSTFGQVIFISYNNPSFNDEHIDFDLYKNEVNSSVVNDQELLTLVNAIEEADENARDNLINITSSSSFIQSLLLFYNNISNDENRLQELLNNTLFSRKININKLVRFSKTIYKYFGNKSALELEEVQKSGLSFASFDAVNMLARNVFDNVNELKSKIYNLNEILTKDVFEKILSLNESKKFIVRISTATSRKIVIRDYDLFLDWIESDLSISQLSEKYFFEVDADYRMSRITNYIADMYEFKLSWIFGILFNIVSQMIYQEFCDIQLIQYLKNISTYTKYGVNSPTCIYLTKYGFNSRETLREMALYIDRNYKYSNMDSFEKILEEIDPYDMRYLLAITEYEVRKIISITNNLKQMTNQIEQQGFIKTHIAGTKYYICKTDVTKEGTLLKIIQYNQLIKLVQERDNFYDEHAVAILFEDTKLGYIPRSCNEEISYYLNLGYSFNITINKIEVKSINEFVNILLTVRLDN